jgi:hypothetical protein
MQNTYALLVGLEKFEYYPENPLDGPCRGAIRMAHLMLDFGVHADNLLVLLEPKDRAGKEAEAFVADLQALKDRGVKTVDHAGREIIHKSWKGFARGKNPASRLLVYWCGHGCTDINGKHLLFYPDYSDTLDDYFQGRDELLRHLRSTAFHVFARQFVFIDACANRLKVPPNLGDSFPQDDKNIAQASFLAARDGEYSFQGAFTDAVLKALTADSWDDPDAFWQRLEPSLLQANLKPFTVWTNTGKTNRAHDYGDQPSTSDLFTDLEPIFRAMEIAEEDYRVPYRDTIEPLAPEPKLWAAATYGAMLRELSLTGLESGERTPRALAEFLLRVQMAAGKKAAALEAWLNNIANLPAPVLASLRQKLRSEDSRLSLIVELEEDRNQRFGELCAFHAKLFSRDCKHFRKSWPRETVSCWEDLAPRLAGPISEAQERAGHQPLAIEFLANPALLDHCPHRIKSGDGLLGERHSVMYRWRQRICEADPFLRQAWLEKAQAIRQKTVKQTKVHGLKLANRQAIPGQLKSKTGIVSLRFLLAPASSSNSSASANERAVLCETLRRGLPFVYWLNDARKPEPWAGLEKSLKKWLKDCRRLDDFPDRVCRERSNYDAFATGGTLFWDDPNRIPDWTLTEVTQA